MRKTLSILTALIIAACTLTACDQQSSQFSSSQAKLDSAMKMFDIAQRGFSSPGPDGQVVDIQSFRQEQLHQAVADLQDVINTGSAQQQLVARKLLATVKQSASSYAAREAVAEFAALSARIPVMTASLQAAERAAANLKLNEVDYDAQLAQLAADSTTLATQQSKLQQQADALTQQESQAQAKQKALQADASSALAEAGKLRQAAFVADDEAIKMKQQDAADDAARQSDRASAEAEKQQIQIDLLQRRLNVVNAQLTTVASQIDNLKKQAEQTRQLQKAAADQIAQLQKDRNDNAEALKAEFDQLSSVYQTSVSSPLASAGDQAAEAVKLLTSVGGQDLLAALGQQANINSQHAITAATWANTIKMLADVAKTAALDQASDYSAAYDQIKTEHDQAAAAAAEAIQAGRDLASSLNNDAAPKMASQLDQYEKELAASALK